MPDRDEFNRDTKDNLARRVGTLCSNPQCSTPTYGPSQTPSKTLSIGVAAHIRAASEGGPRYDPNMSSEQRKSIANGIWLCESCAKLIDTDSIRYTTAVLERWKQVAEKRAAKALENPRIVNIGPDFADTVLVVTIQRNSFFPKTSKFGTKKLGRVKLSYKAIRANRELLETKLPLQLTNKLPDGYSVITMFCQNQGTGIEEYVKFEIHFESGTFAILSTEIPYDRVQLSSGGQKNSNFASFFIRELLPNEALSASVVARSNAEFDAKLWTQNSRQSSEVFIYELTIGEQEIVDVPSWWDKH